MNKWMKKLTAALCAAVLMCGMAVTAYAGGGEEWDGLDPVEPPPAETVAPGEGFTEDGNLVTRDLLYDKATNKQFITVQTSGGNTFYIVIDYDKPTDEDGEQYQTYFLNMVDEADLLAEKYGLLLIMEQANGTRYENLRPVMIELIASKIVPMLADEENSPMMAQIMARNLVDGTVHILKNRVRPSEVRAGLNQLITYHTQGMHALQ